MTKTKQKTQMRVKAHKYTILSIWGATKKLGLTITKNLQKSQPSPDHKQSCTCNKDRRILETVKKTNNYTS